ncbi:hypothetical protein [Streptomyces sp. B6B3]|uniref:hypothetical protein n=1 Tax=Streptomyces sp. B6B3 TaxID=3153570 RepID=UPI00325EDF71
MTDEALPDLERFSDEQQRGLACVRCRRRLPPSWRAARRLGVVADQAGRAYSLYVCAPACPPLPRRVPHVAWPPGGRPNGADSR